LLCLDGASLDVISPAVAAGRLPNFGRMLDAGASMHLATTRPTQPEPVWASIMTGMWPSRHGVRGSSRYRPFNGDAELEVLPDYMFSQALVRFGLLVEEPYSSASLGRQPLWRIAAGYGLSVIDLLADEPPPGSGIVLHRADRRQLVPGQGGVVKELLVRRQAGKRMEPICVTIEPRGGSEGQYDHAGEEFGLVLSGSLELTVEDQVYRVRRGDAFYFSSTRLHGFRNPSRRSRAVVLWVITPPSF
jgi:quercetin dioxygenase-like cupin family protein